MKDKRIVVTGLGALTPIGLSVETFWNSLVRGESGAGLITRYDTTDFKSKVACELKGFDVLHYMDRKQSRRLDPFCHYAVAVAREAVEDAGLDPAALTQEERDRIGVIFGTGIGGVTVLQEQTQILLEQGVNRLSPFLVPMMIANMSAGVIAMEYQFKGPNHCVVSACATGNHSIGDALLLLRAGEADVMLCGGSEAPITEIALGGFGAMRALSTRNDDPETASRPFDADRDGFVPGEGGGVLVLETLEHARARGAHIYAEVVGFGASSDAYHFAAPDPSGDGVKLAMERTLKDAGLQPEDVDYVNMHATSTPLGDIAETNALKRVFGDYAYQMKCSSTKSMTGHLLGAAGAVEAIAAILAIVNNTVPPTINLHTPDPECDLDYTPNIAYEGEINVALSNAFGFGGHNTTVAFKRFDG